MNDPGDHTAIPPHGESPYSILARIRDLKHGDVAWRDGRAWSLVYYVDDEHDRLLKAAHAELASANYLNPMAFRSLHRMEQEVVRMTTHMLHDEAECVGVMTTGGTESILLAMLCYRQRARKRLPRVTAPEVVLPVTIHPAFDKAAELFGLTLRKAPVDENRSAIPAAMEALINDNTILLVASAPSYPNGVLDPIEAIAAIAEKHELPFHVDACVGGFMLPWLERLGHAVPPWDYRIPGVSSISADVHKFGYGAKGASVITYRNMEYLRHQFVVTTDYPGGIYISPTLLGTRAGGPIAAAWAGIRHLGERGYLRLAEKLMDGAQRLRAGLIAIPGIRIVGNPCMNLLSYATVDNKPDIFVIADQMEERGWMVERQQFPDCIHLTVLPTNVERIEEYLEDLRMACAYAAAHPGAVAKGNAAVYGLMARIPFRGMVDKSVRKIMEDLYGPDALKKTGGSGDDVMEKTPAWMGLVNRILTAWTNWRRHRHDR
jgi:glutamate/tyrosine decarboxylase-like PLP-dependent enzyme